MKHWFWLLLAVAIPTFAPAAATNHYDILRQSRWFAISGGPGNAPTPEAYALAEICDQADAVDTFRRLLQENGEAQQIYGLLGLQLVDAPEFKTALPALLKSTGKVRVLRGCIAGEWQVAEVARQIRDKLWRLPNLRALGAKGPKGP